MAFIEPMHRNKPNITYLLPVKKVCRELKMAAILKILKY